MESSKHDPDLLGEVLSIWPRMSRDERRLLACITRRLDRGRQDYGALDLAKDRRDFGQEAGEELVDGVIYLAAELIRRQR